MLTFIVFIISLALLVFLFVMKSREVYRGQKPFLENFFLKGDDLILKLWLKIKYWWSHVNFKNTKLIFSWIIVNIRKLIVAVKRRFDHQQTHFFVKKDHEVLKRKGSASFFLKDVADYKKSLRKSREE